METNQNRANNSQQSRHQRRRNNRRNRNIVRIPRQVWNVFATQTETILHQALMLEAVICTRNEQYLQQNQ